MTTVRGLEDRTKSKLEKEVWEFVSSTPERLLRTTLNFRRVKRKTPRAVWIMAAAGALALVTIITIGAITEGATPKHTASPTRSTVAAPEAPAASPATTPTSTASPEAVVVTDEEVVAAFKSFAAERAAAGVVLGKAVSTVTYSDRIVRVTFDPAAAGIDREMFDRVNNFPNPASFMATPVAFNNDIGNRLRPAIDSIETVRPDGESLGSFTHAEILQLNELQRLVTDADRLPSTSRNSVFIPPESRFFLM